MNKTILATAILLVAGAAQAQEFQGEVSLSYGKAPFANSDDEENASKSAYQLSGWAGASLGDWKVFGDVNVYRRSIGGEDFDSYAPEGARSYGLHFGRNFDMAYVGAFIGRNEFQGSDSSSDNGYVSGKLYGIEGQYEMGSTAFFAQLGRAEMVGSEGETAFIGNFQRVGVSTTIDKLTLTADFEQGRSPNIFEDDGDYGDYRVLGAAVDYQFSERVIGTLSYRSMDAIANTEDNGSDNFYAVGVRVPLGASTGKRNNLTTSYYPGLAAAWAETLD